MNPKLLIAVAAAVAASDFLGNKLANKLVSPEMDGDKTAAVLNDVKVLGSKIATGVGGFILFAWVLKV